jgi:hypothetical protein
MFFEDISGDQNFFIELKDDSAALDIRALYQETEFIYAEIIWDSYLFHSFHVFIARFMRIMSNVNCITTYTRMIMVSNIIFQHPVALRYQTYRFRLYATSTNRSTLHSTAPWLPVYKML